jgi:hypothetical protein
LDLVPQPLGQLDAIRDDTQHGCDLPLNNPLPAVYYNSIGQFDKIRVCGVAGEQ